VACGGWTHACAVTRKGSGLSVGGGSALLHTPCTLHPLSPTRSLCTSRSSIPPPAGDMEAAVQHYTAAVRLVASQWDETLGLDVANLFSNRAAAFAKLGKSLSWGTLRTWWATLRARWVTLKARWGDAKSSLGDAKELAGRR
jgi:hypothetical protein